MKKTIFIFMMSILVTNYGCQKDFSKYLNITSQNKNDTYKAGQRIDVTWESCGVIGNINEINLTSVNPTDNWWVGTLEKDFSNNGKISVILIDNLTISVLPISHGKYFKIQLIAEGGMIKAESNIFTITP